jgi:hypothetical protein
MWESLSLVEEYYNMDMKGEKLSAFAGFIWPISESCEYSNEILIFVGSV